MKSFNFLFVFAALFFTLVAGTTVVLTPTDDTWAAQNVGCGNGNQCCINGADTSLYLGKYSVLDLDTFVEFDLSSLSGVTITSANLTLYGLCGTTGFPSTHNIRFYESPLFSESTLSWSPAIAVGCPNIPSVGTSLGTSTATSNILSKMVTTSVQNAISAGAVAFRLKPPSPLPTGYNGNSMCSKENIANKPTLTIVY